ncbi:hypothetical protein OIU85_000722 [Salix viminalis]|uniref:Retrotransposon gag domain-containing protein n=1 Tax=Salix viminalis TaxID=40686 RepID=A0A9Q0ZXF6_SALVM|nr:hypothetical protein OIU85_000722 [Salix viminalis]
MEQLLAMRQQPPPPSPQHRNDAVERFRKMNPQEFSGGVNPMKAEEWIKSLEAIFEYLHFNDNERVSCAIFMLTTDARTWWESARVTIDVPTLTWVKFKEMFYNKYFTADVKARKIQDFLELKQNGMSVGRIWPLRRALPRNFNRAVVREVHEPSTNTIYPKVTTG